MCLVIRLAAQTEVPADRGSLSGSGKFQARDAPVAPVPDPAARLAELGVKLDADTLKIGLVEIDRKTRAVSFSAKVHAVNGLIEYLLVHANGKVHETLLVTDALPQDIHIACLLAGWERKEGKSPPSILVEVRWESNGPPRCERAENLVSIATGHPQAIPGACIEPGPWIYSGSTVDAAGFAATREGSIISLINDPAALVGNPRPGREDDTLHVPNSKLLPKTGFPVKIVLRPYPSPAPAEKPQSLLPPNP